MSLDPQAVTQHIAPFARSEPAMSALIAAVLSNREVRRGFYQVVKERAESAAKQQPKASAEASATVAELVAAEDAGEAVEVVTEAWLSNAGNLDLALVSRDRNAILGIEHKTDSILGRRQLSKYRLVLRDSDPYRRDPSAGPKRAFSTVLLRPDTFCWERKNQDRDWKHDPIGVEDSLTVTHDSIRHLMPSRADVTEVHTHFLDHAVGYFERVANKEKNGSSEDRRVEVLERVAASLSGASNVISATIAGLRVNVRPRVDGLGTWQIKLGRGDRVLLSLVLPATVAAVAERWTKDLLASMGEPNERERRFMMVHLAAGSPTVGIPTPFPSATRPWLGDLDGRLVHQQALVAANIVQDVIKVLTPECT